MSINIKEGTKAFVKKVADRNGLSLATLTTGRKGQDGKYINSYWNTKFVGKANEPAKSLGEGDRIEISSAIMTKEKAKDGKYYDNLTVFGFEVLAKGQAKVQEGGNFTAVEEDDSELPF